MNDSLAVVLVLVGVVAVSLILLHRKHLRLYGHAWREYNAGAFRELVEPSTDDRFSYVTRLADELSSSKGQCAVFVRSDGGWAIHHVNQNGTFSKRGPYYISRYRGTWHATGRKLLIRTLRGRKGAGFRPDHYNQNGIVYEKGVVILESGTPKYAPVSLGEFVAMQRRAALTRKDAPPRG